MPFIGTSKSALSRMYPPGLFASAKHLSVQSCFAPRVHSIRLLLVNGSMLMAASIWLRCLAMAIRLLFTAFILIPGNPISGLPIGDCGLGIFRNLPCRC